MNNGWHIGTEPPQEHSIDDEVSVPVVVCCGNFLEYKIDSWNYSYGGWRKSNNVHCWKEIGEPPEFVIDKVAEDLSSVWEVK